MRFVWTALAVVAVLCQAACSDDGEGNSSEAAPATAFIDVTASSNIAYKVGFTTPSLKGLLAWQLHTMTNGGAAAGDCDGDGDIDLFITYGNTGGPDGGGGPNRLYLNQLLEQGNGLLFEDFAAQAGVANTRPDGRNNDRHSGPAFADMDGDGDLDLFVGGIYDDPSHIYENQGDCTFIDVTSNSPEVEQMLAAHTISAAFGDYDLDGDLDMFLTHWGTRDDLYGYPRERETDHLWKNESDASGIRFVNASEESGISDMSFATRESMFCGQRFCSNEVGQVQIADFMFTPTFARLNRDVWPDIAIAGDFGTTQIAMNLGNGTFRSLNNPVLREAQFGMGSAIADFDNDGDLDWFVSSILGPGNEYFTPNGNRLFVNDDSAAVLIDDTERLGVADGSFGWGACFVDLDNDSDLDIYHTNGYPGTFISEYDAYDFDPSRVFLMNDAGTYEEAAESLGLAATTSGRGVVCADFDNDGDTDLFELTDGSPVSGRLWENHSGAAGRNFLRIKLVGQAPNTEAAGARIFVRTGEKTQMREIMIGSNYTSQNPTVQVFGLGSAEAVDEVLVEWPAVDAGAGPQRTATQLNGPIGAGHSGETLVIRQPDQTAL